MPDEFIETAVAEMLTLTGGEDDHIRADEILCEVLEKLGHHRLVESYHRVGKWYA